MLSQAILERLRRRAEEEEGTVLEELLLEAVLKDADPPDKAREYARAALQLLREAGEGLEAGNLRQASEKIWGAAALAIKAYAYWRDGKRLSSHGELWQYKTKLAQEFGRWINDAWNAAQAMHTNFYEGWADRASVEDALKTVERLVKELTGRIDPTLAY